MAASVDKQTNVNPGQAGGGADQMVIYVPAGDSATLNGTKLKQFYTVAANLSPTASKRALLVVPSGEYDLGGDDFPLDSEFVDIEGFGASRYNQETGEYTKPGTYIYSARDGNPVIRQTARDVHVRGLRVENTGTGSAYKINEVNGADRSRYVDMHFATVAGETEAPGLEADATNTTISGYFENCHSAQGLAKCETFSGEAQHCSGGNKSFAYWDSAAGTAVALCSGYVEDCIAGDDSYGASADLVACAATFSGIAKSCKGGDRCFGYSADLDGTFSGTAWDCEAGDYCFGSTGTPATQGGIVATTAVLTRCVVGNYCFGGSDTPAGNEQFLGRASMCTGASNCFASDGDFAGICLDCSAGGKSYGGVSGTTAQTGGGLYRCLGVNLLAAIGLRPGIKVEHCSFRPHSTFTNAVLQVTDSTGTAPTVLSCTIACEAAASYAVDSDGAAENIKMALCVLSKDIDPNLTNQIGSGNNVVDADL